MVRPTLSSDPAANCTRCARLAQFRADNASAEPEWHNAPVASFGRLDARLLIVGLAPGLKGANRTGRPFTGDYAGDLLYGTLLSEGFARGRYEARPDDGLTLVDCRITNAVRCVPPANKPTPTEIRTCSGYLAEVIAEMPRLRIVVCLGRIAHDSVVRTLKGKLAQFPFAHGAVHAVSPSLSVYDSYHCSRYNTNTGVLTEAMFAEVFRRARNQLSGA